MKYLLLLISTSSFAQLRAPVQQTIFYQSETNLPTKIEIYQDSVRAFDLTWNIKRKKEVKAYGDILYRGEFDLSYQSQKAQIQVIGRRVLVIVEGITRFSFDQQAHEGWRYMARL